MKKRRTIIISLILVAALAIGIGYAGQASKLIVRGGGNIDADPSNFKLEFTGVTVDGAETDYADIQADKTTAEFNISHLDKKGESIVFVYTIKNVSPGEIKAYLDEVITMDPEASLTLDEGGDLTLSDYYTITTTIAATELEYNAETTLTVSIECIETITDNVTLAYEFYLQGHSDPASVKKATP